jgi:hypothetical protein
MRVARAPRSLSRSIIPQPLELHIMNTLAVALPISPEDNRYYADKRPLQGNLITVQLTVSSIIDVTDLFTEEELRLVVGRLTITGAVKTGVHDMEKGQNRHLMLEVLKQKRQGVVLRAFRPGRTPKPTLPAATTTSVPPAQTSSRDPRPTSRAATFTSHRI